MAISGIELSAGIKVGVSKPVDAKYGPFADVATAKSEIAANLRYLGLTVGIETGGVVEEYWWESGTADADLVAKGGGGGTWGSITGTLSDQTDLQSALDAKEPTITATTSADYYRGDKTFATLDKTAVGLSNVDNTSDLNKPISTATQTALDLKVDENAAITGDTKTKITYDAKGLVTGGADATTADIADSADKRYVTDAQLTVIGNTSGTNTGDNAVNSLYSGLEASKQDVITGAATTITSTDLTASRALVSDGSGKVAVSSVTDTELGYVSGVTSAVQTQINSKISTYDGATYDVTALAAVSQAEYDAIDPKSDTTLYFII